MNSKPLVALSLALNVVLAAALAWAVKSKPTLAPADSATAAQTVLEKKSSPPVVEEVTTPASASEPAKPAQAFDWQMVESADYRKYIENLRAIGCPEETIRDIIVADVNKLFESRKKAIRATAKKFEYWKAGNMFSSVMDPERIEKEQALAKEKRDLLVALLGTAPAEKPNLLAAFNPFEQMMDFLPDAKQAEVMEVMQSFQAKIMKAVGGGGAPDSDDMKQMQKLQKEMETKIASLMSPQEFEEYQLRLSQTAMVMRMQLASFDPNEQEFREIFKVKKQYDDQYSLLGGAAAPDVDREKRDAAKKQMDQQIKNLLGEARYAEYERAQDSAYQNIYRVADKNNLGKNAANQVYEMKKTAEEEAKRVRADQSLTKEQRDAALAGIRTETESAIKTVFGEKAYSSYENQAWWLRNISPNKPQAAQ